MREGRKIVGRKSVRVVKGERGGNTRSLSTKLNGQYIFPCCGMRVWIRAGIESMFWSHQGSLPCPGCGHKGQSQPKAIAV